MAILFEHTKTYNVTSVIGSFFASFFFDSFSFLDGLGAFSGFGAFSGLGAFSGFGGFGAFSGLGGLAAFSGFGDLAAFSGFFSFPGLGATGGIGLSSSLELKLPSLRSISSSEYDRRRWDFCMTAARA